MKLKYQSAKRWPLGREHPAAKFLLGTIFLSALISLRTPHEHNKYFKRVLPYTALIRLNLPCPAASPRGLA
jgi:hypothetical protein